MVAVSATITPNDLSRGVTKSVSSRANGRTWRSRRAWGVASSSGATRLPPEPPSPPRHPRPGEPAPVPHGPAPPVELDTSQERVRPGIYSGGNQRTNADLGFVLLGIFFAEQLLYTHRTVIRYLKRSNIVHMRRHAPVSRAIDFLYIDSVRH